MSVSAVLDLLKKHYEREAKDRADNQSPSKIYPQEIQNLDKEASEWAFGCANLLSHLDGEEVDGKSVLDFGCGAGTDMIYLRRLFEPREVFGIDLASSMIQKANKLFQDRGFTNLSAEKISLFEIPETRKFDLILSNAVIHLNPEKERVFQHLYNISSNKSVMILSDFVVSKPLPESLKQHYKTSKGLFLFGGLIPMEEYVSMIHLTGFEEVDRMELLEFSPHEEIRTMLDREDVPASDWKDLDQIKFHILVLRCKKKVERESIAFRCTSCEHINSMPFYRSLNLEIHRNLGTQLLNGNLNQGICSECSFEQLPAPFQVHDMKGQKMCFLFPREYDVQEARLRSDILEPCQKRLPDYEMDLCFSFADFKRFLSGP